MDLVRNFALPAIVLLAIVWVFWYGRRRTHDKATRYEAVADDKVLDQRNKLQRAMEQLQVNIMEFGRDVEGRLDTKIAVLKRLLADADERIKHLETLTKSGQSRQAGEVLPLHREIYRLADEGLDKVEIARRTSATPGEVELILSLRKQRNG